MKIREPKTLDTYLPANETAHALEQLAAQIRAQANYRPLVKWSLSLSFWNPAWNEPGWKGELIVRQLSYVSGPPKAT